MSCRASEHPHDDQREANSIRVLIVGYGNPLRGDDAVGWKAAERLEQLLKLPGVEIQTGHQLLPELADPLSRAELAILIDASCDGPAGQVSCRPVVPAGSGQPGMTHGFEPPDLLACARSVFGRCAKTMLFTISAQSFEHGAELTEPARRALDEVVQSVCDLVEGWLSATCS